MKRKLLEKLKNYIKENSVNDLKNVKPYVLREYLNITMKEFNDFIEFLESERLLEFKFNCKCYECNTEHTIYKSQFKNRIFECDVCESELDIEKLVENKVAIYSIYRNEVLNFNKENIDYIKSFEVISSIEKKEKAKIIHLDRRERKMKIFLGSSTESTDIMELVATIIEQLGNEAITWNQPGLFIGGQYPLDSLIEITKKVDAAIFIFSEDDKTWFRDDEIKSVRDNVLLEYGLFTGGLSREKVIFVVGGNPKIASDLTGITYLKSESGRNTLKTEIKAWIESIKQNF